jgi:uncharacterized protein YacL
MNHKTKLIVGLILANVLAYLWWGNFRPMLNIQFSIIIIVVFSLLHLTNHFREKNHISTGSDKPMPKLPSAYVCIFLTLLHLPIFYAFFNKNLHREAPSLAIIAAIFYFLLWTGLGLVILNDVLNSLPYLFKNRRSIVKTKSRRLALILVIIVFILLAVLFAKYT